MRGNSGSMFHFDGFREEGRFKEYVLTDEKWSCDYRLGGVDYHEEATSENGSNYEGTWGEPGERDPAKTSILTRYKAKNSDNLMIVRWFDGDREADWSMYQLPGENGKPSA